MTLHHVRYKQSVERQGTLPRWHSAYFETVEGAEAFVDCWEARGRLAEYKGRREDVV